MNTRYLLLVLITVFFTACNKSPLVINLSQEKIQKVLDKKFPYKKSTILAKVELTNPVVTIKNDKIFTNVSFNGSALNKVVRGQVSVSGRVAYKQKKKAFYLKDFEIINVTVENVKESKKDKVVGVVKTITSGYFASFPVYKLKKKNYKQNIARMLLKDVKTEGNNLVVKLAF